MMRRLTEEKMQWNSYWMIYYCFYFYFYYYHYDSILMTARISLTQLNDWMIHLKLQILTDLWMTRRRYSMLRTCPTANDFRLLMMQKKNRRRCCYDRPWLPIHISAPPQPPSLATITTVAGCM
jgi:hypothetical protein